MFAKLCDIPLRSFHMSRGGIILVGDYCGRCDFCDKRPPVFGYPIYKDILPKDTWIGDREAFLCNDCSLRDGMFDNLKSEYIDRGYTKYTVLLTK